jgi:hypothetical protein
MKVGTGLPCRFITLHVPTIVGTMRCPTRRLAGFSWFFAEAVLLTKKDLHTQAFPPVRSGGASFSLLNFITVL